jgi:hypothetical protein
VPKLDEHAYEQVELSGVPFSLFVDNKARNSEQASHSFVLRGYVRTWMRQVEAEFDRVKLLDILAAKKPKR